MFTNEHVGFSMHSMERVPCRVEYCPHILDKLLRKFRLDENPSTLLKVVAGLVLVERIRDATHSGSNHPIYLALKKSLAGYPKDFMVDDDWLVTMILGGLISSPEYQLLSISFRLVPLYFETLDEYYNISNSRYIVDVYTGELGSDSQFLRAAAAYLKRYGQAAKNRFDQETPPTEALVK